MSGALDLTQPAHLMRKLEHELRSLEADHADSYAAINALRDAYHLREWIWHDRLQHDSSLRTAVMSTDGDETAWNQWVNASLPDFIAIREVCNGSKHFEPGKVSASTHRSGFDSVVPFFDNPSSGFDDCGFHVQIGSGGRIVAVVELVRNVRDFWADLFQRFPQLC